MKINLSKAVTQASFSDVRVHPTVSIDVDKKKMTFFLEGLSPVDSSQTVTISDELAADILAAVEGAVGAKYGTSAARDPEEAAEAAEAVTP
jgi:hypothetical protein